MSKAEKNLHLDGDFSLYLDLTRFVAAAMVVLAHYVQHNVVTGEFASFIPDMGREAVVVFFVLSGFVIAYATEKKSTSAREYIAARCGRIYSVVLPTLALGWLLASAFSDEGAYQLAKPYIYIPLHLLFLGQSWNLSEVPPMLAPFWSLCYEVWYYVLFGVAYYFRGWRRSVTVVAVLAIMGFKLWLLLPVWLSGVALYYLQHRVVLAPSIARAGVIVSFFLLILYNVSDMETSLKHIATAVWPFPLTPLASAERFLADYVVCTLVFVNFFCARYARLSGLIKFSRQIRGVASYTFTLYLSHMLVISIWLKSKFVSSENLHNIIGLTIAVGLVTVALAQVTERRKDSFRLPIEWIIRKTFPIKP